MAYELQTKAEIVTARRILIQGPPNSGKTESLMTWPRPIHIQVFPGEKGHATIPRGQPDIFPYVWGTDAATGLSSHTVVQQVETLTWEILGGKYGPVITFAGDGFHKYYWFVLDWMSGGALSRGEEIGAGGKDEWAAARIHNRTRDYVRFYIQRILSSAVPYVVFNTWDGREADKPGAKTFHIYPDLPGKSAKEIVGEFSATLHSTVEWHLRQPKGKAPAYWLLKPEGEVWGASVKVPFEIWDKLPVRIAQSLPVFEQTLEAAWKSASASVNPASNG